MKNGKDNNASEFQLGDLVLAKFEEYPFWPALIQKCFWKDEKKRDMWRLSRRGRRTPKLWCFFLNDNSANWVEETLVERFEPDRAQHYLVDEEDEDYEAQKGAIDAAMDMYNKKRTGADMETEDDEFDDDDERRDVPAEQPVQAANGVHRVQETAAQGAEEEEQADHAEEVVPVRKKRGRPPKQRPDAELSIPGSSGSKGRKKRPTSTPEASLLPSLISHRPSQQQADNVKRSSGSDAGSTQNEKKRIQEDTETDSVERRSKKAKTGSAAMERKSLADTVESLREELENKESELHAAIGQVKKLRKIVRERDALISEYKTSPSKGLIDIPHFPDPKELDLPPESEYQTKPMTSEEFGKVLQELNKNYVSFRSRISKSIALRNELDDKIQNIRAELKQPCDQIEEEEKLAVADEVAITKVLGRIIVGQVSMDDLRQHRAGKVVNKVRKSCSEMPQILFLSTKIADIWKEQVRQLNGPSKSGKDGSADEKQAGVANDQPMTGENAEPNGGSNDGNAVEKRKIGNSDEPMTDDGKDRNTDQPVEDVNGNNQSTDHPMASEIGKPNQRSGSSGDQGKEQNAGMTEGDTKGDAALPSNEANPASSNGDLIVPHESPAVPQSKANGNHVVNDSPESRKAGVNNPGQGDEAISGPKQGSAGPSAGQGTEPVSNTPGAKSLGCDASAPKVAAPNASESNAAAAHGVRSDMAPVSDSPACGESTSNALSGNATNSMAQASKETESSGAKKDSEDAGGTVSQHTLNATAKVQPNGNANEKVKEMEVDANRGK